MFQFIYTELYLIEFYGTDEEAHLKCQKKTPFSHGLKADGFKPLFGLR